MSLEQTIDNLQIRNANMVTFVGTSNTMVDTTTGRIQTKGIQHNSNVITDVSGPHGRGVATLKKYPEMIFEDEKVDRNDTTNTYTQAGYTISTDSVYGDRQVYKAFSTKGGEGTTTAHIWSSEDVGGNGYVLATGDPISGVTFQDENGTSYTGHYIKLELPKKIKLNSISFKSQKSTYNSTNNDKRPTSGTFLGSNDGTNWVLLKTFNEGQLSWSGGLVPGATVDYVYSTTLNNIVSDGYFSYILFVIETIGNNNEYGPVEVRDLKYYGYEEDPPAGDHSVDTTFKSRFNNPQTTGVQVLVDGATGVGTNQISSDPDPSGNQSTYVTDGKYWTLNGTLTSNFSVEANTFLEGDQPHAVSVWFNSSNLEANVSNTCVFSIASEEKLDSVNLDLQSNTWHNLTYAYQGEGGSRVTYLDGRKVAEDQAEDTFGEYPPFAMTGYSQGGYVVSASSENSSYPAHEAFKNFPQSQNERWQTNRAYTSAGLPHTDSPTTLTYKGEWIQLEQPYKLKINYLKMQAHSQVQHQPENWVILGSNDGTIWEFIKERLDASSFNVDSNGYHINTDVIDSPKFYKYHRIVITKSGATAGTEQPIVVGISLYGHRENDLVRLPDPTNVLKYPHIAMTGPAQRGYVASASSTYDENYNPWEAFDDQTSTSTGTPLWGYWSSTAGSFNTSSPFLTNRSGSPYVTSVSGTPYTGEWLQLELPHKLKVNSIKYKPRATGGMPRTGVVAGSNDGTSWVQIFTYQNLSASTLATATDLTPNSSVSTSAFKYIRIIMTHANSAEYASAQDVQIYGTGVDSIPIQIGGGNIDKVANFRVYDKFVGEDQALEIWNAQKEEFGRAKPQMVLQQGKLGIGTDAPQGSLSVADEPHNLEEFPPRAMTSSETYIEGHGVFKASASYTYPDANYGPSAPWRVFSKDVESQTTGWISSNDHNAVTGSNPGEYNGTNQLTSSTPLGEWLKIELPHKIKLNSYALKTWGIANRYGVADYPKTFYIYGSNDGSSWELIDSRVNTTKTPRILGAAVASYETINYSVSQNALTYYDKYAIVITKINSEAVYAVDNTVAALYVALGEWRLFGTREQGQSVLHDGQLTLTKNLTVPRIGPALDADDTPRRDRLVVEYNTSTNPTFEGAVRDTSGRGNDGVFYGGASYDATEKALVFDGTASDQYVHTLKNGTSESGNINYSVSLWFNPTTVNVARWRAIFAIGVLDRTQPTDNNGDEITLFVNNGTNALHLQNGGSSVNTGALNAGQWVHIVVTYDGTNRKIYLDGSLSLSNGYTSLNLPKEMLIRLAQSIPNGGSEIDEYMDCKISNFKAWFGAALTAQEVKRLYDMGRTGSVANPQPLHISGPVNVMGDIRYITSRPLALPTMWDHMANGNCAKGVYPIVGRNGGNTIYHVYCEPDWAGGGWMCMAQFAKNGYQVKAHPTNGDLNIFTKGLGDSKNIRWNNTFAVPLNILSLDGNGYDLDVMIVALGGGYAGRYEGGMRVGSIWRGHQLSVAFNPGTSSYPGASGLASSSDGYSFTTRTPVTNQQYDMINSGGWYYSCAANANYNGSYTDQGLSDGGYILHHGNTNYVGSIYGAYHSDTGVAYNSQGNTEFACVRIFVRPSIY